MRSFAFFGLLILGLIGIKLSQARRETIRETGFEALGEVQSILSQLEEAGEENVDWPGFPLSDVPLQEIAQQVAAGCLRAKPIRVFGFEEIHEAHRVMEAGEAGGKMVVVHG
jgi:Zinc-binding dehydrogenase